MAPRPGARWLRSLYTTATTAWALHRLPTSRPRPVVVAPLGRALQRDYLVTSSGGLYLLAEGVIRRLLRHKIYGIALAPPHLYLAVAIGLSSVVVRCRYDALRAGRGALAMERLYTQQATDLSDRIHALSLAEEGLWVANTGRNTLLRLDPQGAAQPLEIPPFYDRFGTPLYYNVNHLNSVTALPGGVLFVANRAGERSLIGLLAGGRVRCHGYPRIGVHDAFLTRRGLLFCDTFGEHAPGPPYSGRVMLAGEALDEPWFARRQGIVRGVAGDPEGELLVGNSVRGTRQERFHGAGSLIVLQGGEVTGEIPLPGAAQIYQIVQTDGGTVRPPPAPTPALACDQLSAALGPALLDEPLLPLPAYVALKWGRRGGEG